MSEKGPYVWAMVPPNMHGTHLVSANFLKIIDPDAATQALRKYDGRPALRDLYVKELDCLWTDLIFLSPYDPREMQHHIKEAGHPTFPRKYFQIPVSRLKESGLEIRWMNADGGKTPLADTERLMAPLNLDTYESPAFPQEQIEEYKRAKTENRRFLILGHAPHIIVAAKADASKGPSIGIDISGCEIVTTGVANIGDETHRGGR